MSDYSLKEYFAERMDFLQLVEVKNDGGVDYMIRIDGTYFGDGADGMLDYHNDLFKKVLRAEGLL